MAPLTLTAANVLIRSYRDIGSLFKLLDASYHSANNVRTNNKHVSLSPYQRSLYWILLPYQSFVSTNKRHNINKEVH